MTTNGGHGGGVHRSAHWPPAGHLARQALGGAPLTLDGTSELYSGVKRETDSQTWKRLHRRKDRSEELPPEQMTHR